VGRLVEALEGNLVGEDGARVGLLVGSVGRLVGDLVALRLGEIVVGELEGGSPS